MPHRRGSPTAAVAVLLAVLITAGAAAGSAAKLRTIGKATASGDYAIAIASGDVDDPNVIYGQVTARPAQHVDGYWTVVCSRGFGAGSKSGSFAGQSPVRRKLRLPMAHPDNCIASVSGSLDRSGKVVVAILAG